jgi:hypothetical protein
MREKIIATLLSAIMALTSITPVLALDLGDYPGFLFDEDQNLQAFVVVGGAAQVADVVGAVDLAVRLAGESYEEVSVTGGVAVAGGEEEEVGLGMNVSDVMGSTFDDSDVAGLLDTKIDFADDDIDIHEEIAITTDLHVAVSGEKSLFEEFGDTVALVTEDEGAIMYKYVFDDEIDPDEVSDNEPLLVTLLGNELRITKISGTNDTIEVEMGTEAALGEGDTLTVAGKTLTINVIGSESISVSVDGSTEFLGKSEESEIGNTGVSVLVDSILYTDDPESRRVFVRVGTETSETYEDGESMTLFGEPEDEDDATWIWRIDMTAPDQYLAAEHNQRVDEEDENPPLVGEYIEFPNDWGKIGITELTVSLWGTWEIYFDDVDSEDDVWNNENCVVFKAADASDNEGLLVDTSIKTSEVYVNDAGDIGYLDDENDVIISSQNSETDGFKITSEDFVMQVYINASSGNGMIEQDTTVGTDTNDILFTIAATWDGLGVTVEEAETADVSYGGDTIGTQDHDVMTRDGVVIKDPEDNADADKVVLEVPVDDRVEAVVLIAGPGTTIGEAAGETVKKVVPVTNAVSKLDSEVSLPVNKHLVLVGGPGVNELTAEAMGYDYPTYGSQMTGEEFGVGEGYIKVFEDVLEEGYVAVVVAGWEATETRRACSVLQQYASFADELDGNVAVTVTSLTAEGIVSAE